MKTRRKSKAESVVPESDEELDGANDPASFTLELPEDIDVDSLQEILPDVSISSPSQDAIVSIYRILLAQVQDGDALSRELEEARAEAERKDVELDQALQDKESQAKEYEASLEAMQKDTNNLKQEKEQLG
ncbi:hypothetical protein HWV62_38883 [Athelia sp. TMB]|nr:hypothetical protein HWV62_38883 [Athelia sp. TMB]